MKFKNVAASVVAASAMLFGGHAAAQTNVALELMLLVDVSGSVDDTEYDLQKQGYVQAFQSAGIQAAIAGLPGGIAVTYIEWSSSNQQSVEVDWTLVTDAMSANSFAAQVNAATRNFSGATAPGSALNFGVPLFASNLFDGDRQVIDVSGDGSQNDGANTAAARTAALAAGIDAINGLAILGSEGGLEAWYNANIKGGATGFVIAANNFGDFARAVTIKLEREITGVPEPTSLALVGLALLGAGVVRRRANKA